MFNFSRPAPELLLGFSRVIWRTIPPDAYDSDPSVCSHTFQLRSNHCGPEQNGERVLGQQQEDLPSSDPTFSPRLYYYVSSRLLQLVFVLRVYSFNFPRTAPGLWLGISRVIWRTIPQMPASLSLRSICMFTHLSVRIDLLTGRSTRGKTPMSLMPVLWTTRFRATKSVSRPMATCDCKFPVSC